MLQSAKGPMSYCLARTTPTLLGAGETKNPVHFFLGRPHPVIPPLASPRPSAQPDSHDTEDPRLYHSCAAVRRPRLGCRQNDRRSPGSPVSLQCLTTDSHDWCRKAFHFLFFLFFYNPPGTAKRFMRKAEGRMRQEEGGRLSDL